MKKLICSDRCPVVLIEPHLSPLLLSLDPYVGESFYHLKVSDQLMRGVAYVENKAVHFVKWSEVPKDSTFIVIQEGDKYTTYLTLSHLDQVVSLEGEEEGLLLKGVSGASRLANQIRPAFLSMQGEDLHGVVQKTWLQALLATGGIGKPAYDKPLPRWFDRAGFAADGMSGAGEILDKAKSFGYPLGFVIIGEGWQECASQAKLLSFDADPIRFPQGLKQLIEDLKKLGIPYVGVCHAMMGGPRGIHPQLAKKYDLPPDLEGRYFLGYDMGRTFEFYHDYYTYLREMGVSFVKVTHQKSPFSFCRLGMDVTRLYKNLQMAMQAAGSVHFHSSHFNADCLINPNLFYWGHSSMAEVAPSNCLVEALQNSFWMETLAHPDRGVLRGSPLFYALSKSLYQVDHPNQGLEKILLPNGRALHPDQPLRICTDSFFIDPMQEKAAYKAFTTKGSSGVVAAFNVCGKSVQGRVGPRDVPGLLEERYAVASDKRGFLGVCSIDERLSFQLEDEDVFTLAPIHRGVAVLGTPDYYLALGPIIEVDIEEESVHISALVGRPLFLYCERDVLEVRRDGETIPWEYDSAVCTLMIDSFETASDSRANYTITFA